MQSTTIDRPVRSRPGGRTARTTELIHSAVLEVLVNEGLPACTLGRIAEVTGVQRSTLYRRFADRWEMILQSYLASAEKVVVVEPSGDLVEDFKVLMARFVDHFSGPIGQVMMTVVFAVRGTAAEVHVDRFMESRMAQFEPIFTAAIAAGNIHPGIDRQEVLERTAGAAVFRMFVEGLPVDAEWLDRMARALERLYSLDQEETAS